MDLKPREAPTSQVTVNQQNSGDYQGFACLYADFHSSYMAEAVFVHGNDLPLSPLHACICGAVDVPYCRK